MEELLQLMNDTASMLRGMTMDPTIPAHAKDAMRLRIAELEEATETELNNWVAKSVKVGEIFGRDDLHSLVNKPSHLRNGPDIQTMHRSIDWLYDEREKLIGEAVALTKEVEDYKSLIAVFQSDAPPVTPNDPNSGAARGPIAGGPLE